MAMLQQSRARLLRRLSQQMRVPRASMQRRSGHATSFLADQALQRQWHVRGDSHHHTRAFSSCGSKKPKVPVDSGAPKPIPEEAFYFEEFKAFLALDDPSEIAKADGRRMLDDVLTNMLVPEILGIQATTLTLVAQKIQDTALVLRVYRALRETGIQPSPLTLHITAETCAASPDDVAAWETALDVVEQMHGAVHLMPVSQEIYEHAIETCAAATQWIVAFRLLGDMQRFARVPSAASWTAVVGACLAAGEVTAAVTVVKNLERSADAVDFDADVLMEELLLTAVTHHQSAFALALLETMYNQWQEETARHHGGGRRSWFAHAHETPLELETLTYTQRLDVVDLLAADQHWLGLDQWLPSLGFRDYVRPAGTWKTSKSYMQLAMHIHAFLATHATPSAAVSNALMLGFGRHKMRDDALALLQRHPCPDATSYYGAITACGDDADAAMRLVEAYTQTSGAAPTTINDDPPPSRHPKLRHTHVDVTNAALTSLNKACRAADMLALARQLAPAQAKNSRTLAAVVHAHRALGDWLAVIDGFKEIKMLGLACTGYVYGDAIRAYAHIDQVAQALWLYHHVEAAEPEMKHHAAVVAAVWTACSLSDDPAHVTTAMELFRALSDDDVHDVLHVDGALALLLTIRNAETAYLRKTLLEEVWPVLLATPRLFMAADGTSHSTVLDHALHMAVHDHDVALAEDLVTDADDAHVVYGTATYTHFLRLYSQPPVGRDGAVDWRAPPAHPNRFLYWWDAMQGASVVPNEHTVTALLAAIRRGLPLPLSTHEILDLMETAWHVRLSTTHCEFLFAIYGASETGAAAADATDLLRRMHDHHVDHSGESMAAALACLATAPAQWPQTLVDAANRDVSVAEKLVLAAETSADVVFLLDEKLNLPLTRRALRHALTSCEHDASAANMRRICEYLEDQGGDVAALSGTVKVNVKRMLERWSERAVDEPWRTTLFQGSV
ncbi:Aste57867_24414 [Aphanomyces stellatus]|uniref:Aste57867_24414 protein n=1 Tax=Aphanomyces stellatus TaxID=120398 RepID=A0A485LQ98_9STRA|nr:hypothetical protein As57867_024338 [Aphanomyces stellatus]VFU01054.1 Aste57867_24414 [Aphanomyces stellatus]